MDKSIIEKAVEDGNASVLRWYTNGKGGTFLVELEDDNRWSVKQLFGDDILRKSSIQGSQYMRDSAGRFGWNTRDEAIHVARDHAGLIPPPDRRGLVAHTKALL